MAARSQSAGSSRPRRFPRRSGQSPLRLGFIALADCAPLLVAQEDGYFIKQGLNVRLSREVGWATIREKLASGELDGAHAVCGLSLTMPFGLQAPACEVATAFVMNHHGNAITLSQDLWRRGVRGAADLGKLIRSNPGRLITLATVSRTSSHFFMMRHWLLAAGLDPQRSVRLMVLPPTQMASSLKVGLIDGFCAGEPWNSLAVAEGSGWVAATSAEILPGHPEKVLLAGSSLLHERAEEHLALIRALAEACACCDEIVRRPWIAALLAASGYFDAAADFLHKSLVGPFDTGVGEPRSADGFHLFYGDGEVNRPSLVKAKWVARELGFHGVVTPAQLPQLTRHCATAWREDIYREALGLGPSPQSPTPATHPKPHHIHLHGMSARQFTT